jgi:nitrate reductase (NAD(P)H)
MEYTPNVVSQHTCRDDCWIIIRDKVYDITSYLSSHPGGAEIILNCAGKNATREFDDIGHSKNAVKILQKYEIGTCSQQTTNRDDISWFNSIISWFLPKRTILLQPNQNETVKLISRTQITHDTISLTFAIPDGMSLGLSCGQHIICHYGETKRKYTPISDIPGSFELIVKVYETGTVSPYLANLKIGDQLVISGPNGRNIYLGDGSFSVAGQIVKSKHIVMICAGSGITPIFAVFRKISQNNEYSINASMLFVNKTSDDIIMREEIDQICFNHPNMNVQYSLTQKNSNWSGLTGRPSPNMIANIAKHNFDGIVLICGSSEFNTNISKICSDLGFAKSNIIIF